jgi:6-phospho-3-hexuloisomerase
MRRTRHPRGVASGPSGFAATADAVAGARRIVLHGVGREGPMMRALAMRLHHLGLDAHVAGDMTAPPVGPDDLLAVSARPGQFGTVAALVDLAARAGAATACVTARPGGAVPARCGTVRHLPAQTMADDVPRRDGGDAPASVLAMGSLHEGAQYVAFEVLVLMLRERLGVAPEAMRARHTNLE